MPKAMPAEGIYFSNKGFASQSYLKKLIVQYFAFVLAKTT